jgi:inorganic pyrophosphatase
LQVPDEVTVEIEVPRGGFLKRRADGAVDFVSPVPCPFNYGSVPGLVGGDGDPLDAVVLGPGRVRGELVPVRVRAVVRFVDRGETDDKLICAATEPSAADRVLVVAFFRVYARCKQALYALRGRPGLDTRFVGWEARP